MLDINQQILSILQNYKSKDENELASVDFITQLVSNNPNSNFFQRSNSLGHFTGSALIVYPNGQQFLLHLHKKLNLWLQFGGHADDEHDLSSVAMREAIEETGLPDLQFLANRNLHKRNIYPVDIDVHWIPANNELPTHPHLDFRYILTTNLPSSLMPADKTESRQFNWHNFSEMDRLLGKVDVGLVRLIRKAGKIIHRA